MNNVRRVSWMFSLLLVACAGAEPDDPDSGMTPPDRQGRDAAADLAGDAAAADASGGDASVTAPSPIGANLPFLFLGYLGTAPGGVAAARRALDDAKAAGIGHVRFIASSYYPNEMKQAPGWMATPDTYWQAFDAMLADAHQHGIKVVPSMLWNTYLFPDIAGEPTGQLFVPGSKTRMLAEKYVTEMVTRYAGSEDILFWEMGNEFNLAADIDISSCNVCNGATNGCATLAPALGTPCQRTTADNYFSCNSCRQVSSAQQDLGEFTGAIAALVHAIDKKHGFSSGDSYPRTAAWHLGVSPCPSCDFTPDSPAEYEQALLHLHPDGVDVVSVHHYPDPETARYGSNDATGSVLLPLTESIVEKAGKTLYVGEFGEKRGGSISCGGQNETCGGDPNAAQTRFILDGLVTAKVPRAAIWALDFFQFCADVPSCYTVTPADPIVASITVHNQATTACAGQPDGTACPIGACVANVCTPRAAARFGFDQAGDDASWTFWTNCSGCTPASEQLVGGALSISSHDLPCTGACGYPGAYALSPSFPVVGARLLVRLAGRSSGTAKLRIIPSDENQHELPAELTLPVPTGAKFGSNAGWFELPAGTAKATVRLELDSPNATVDIDEVVAVTQP